MWAEPEPKTTVLPMSCTQSIGQKLYCKPMVLMENGTLPKGAFGDTPTKYQEPKIGNPKHTTNFRFQKFIPSILSHVEKKSLISTVRLFLKSEQNGEISPGNLVHWLLQAFRIT